MERFQSKEHPDTELLYDGLKQRLEFSSNSIEWWQGLFGEFTQAKQYLADPKLAVEIDAFIGEYEDLTKYLRKDQKSMDAAQRTAVVLAQKIMDELKRE
jgi:hypothetical protein